MKGIKTISVLAIVGPFDSKAIELLKAIVRNSGWRFFNLKIFFSKISSSNTNRFVVYEMKATTRIETAKLTFASTARNPGLES